MPDKPDKFERFDEFVRTIPRDEHGHFSSENLMIIAEKLREIFGELDDQPPDDEPADLASGVVEFGWGHTCAYCDELLNHHRTTCSCTARCLWVAVLHAIECPERKALTT